MKEFTAIYSTETIKNIQYSFKSDDLSAALSFANSKFSAFPNIILVENTPEGRANEGRVVWANGFEVK